MWENIYQRKPTDIETLVLDAFHRLFISSDRIHFFPNISSTVMAGATSTYLQLKVDELLIAIFDETVLMRHAKEGFAVTTKRLCWKNLAEEVQSLDYASIPGPIMINGTNIELGQGLKINAVFNKEKNEAVVQFLREVREASKKSAPKMAETINELSWHISIGGSQFGPYEANSIKSMLASGQLVPAESFVWRQGMTDWQPFLQVPELSALVQTAPPKIKTAPPPPPKTPDQSPSFMSLDDALDRTVLPKAAQNEKGVDLNNAPLDGLLTLPGISLIGAQKLTEERAKLRGFDSYEEIGALLELQPHQVEKLKVTAVINPYKGAGSATSAGKRVIDF